MKNLSLLAVYAHPDDESYGSAGTLSKYAHEGVHASLISATRGEAGAISDPTLASAERLGAVREAELRHACAIMGVSELLFLDCRDGAVAACPRETTIGKIVAAIREWQPQVVITFGPEGIYGHPDHIAVHHLTVAACDLTGDPQAYPEQLAAGLTVWAPQKVYYRILPRHQMPQLANLFRDIRAGLGLEDTDLAAFFAPEELVTTAIDVTAYVDIKRQAIAAHRTQMDGEPYSGQSPEEVRAELGCEYYHLRGTRRASGEPLETDLFAGLRQSRLR